MLTYKSKSAKLLRNAIFSRWRVVHHDGFVTTYPDEHTARAALRYAPGGSVLRAPRKNA